MRLQATMMLTGPAVATATIPAFAATASATSPVVPARSGQTTPTPRLPHHLSPGRSFLFITSKPFDIHYGDH